MTELPADLVELAGFVAADHLLGGHLHAAAFRFQPIQRGAIDLQDTLGRLFEPNQLQGVVHLLNDDRGASGAGKSEIGGAFARALGVPFFRSPERALRALAAIQKAYGDWGGAQCGYCTPGFMVTVKALLDRNPDPTEEDIRRDCDLSQFYYYEFSTNEDAKDLYFWGFK